MISALTALDESVWRMLCIRFGQYDVRAHALWQDHWDATMILALERTRAYTSPYRPADYPYSMVHCLIRSELASSGSYDWL